MFDKPLLDFAKKLMAYDGQDVRAVNALDMFGTSPAHHHPDDPLSQRLMRGVQEGLGQLGYKVSHSGFADHATAQAISAAIGSRWRWMAWQDIYANLKAALGR